MLAQGDQGSRVRGPIASLSSLVGASPAKSRQLLPQLSVPSVTGLSLSPVLEVVCCRESTRTRWGGRPSLLGRWNTKWGITCLARGRAQGDSIAPDATSGRPGSGAPSRVPEKNKSSARRRAPNAAESPGGAAPSPRPGAGCCAVLRPPRARAFARHLLSCHAATPRAGNSRSNRLRVSGSRSNQYVGSPSGAGAEPRSGRARGVS